MTFIAVETVLPPIVQSLGVPAWLISLAPSLILFGNAIMPLFSAHVIEGMLRKIPALLSNGFYARLPMLLADKYPLLTLAVVRVVRQNDFRRKALVTYGGAHDPRLQINKEASGGPCAGSVRVHAGPSSPLCGGRKMGARARSALSPLVSEYHSSRRSCTTMLLLPLLGSAASLLGGNSFCSPARPRGPCKAAGAARANGGYCWRSQ